MIRILIVEDNSTNLFLMTYLLEKFGYATLTAANGAEGLAAALRENPDLIICDLHMPRVNGWEFAERIKKDPIMGSVPLIAVTAFAMVGDRERVLSAGFDGYITKPIDPETFIARVEAFLPEGNLPTAPAFNQLVEGVAVPVASRPANNGTVLVVDDTTTNCDLVRCVLESAGYTVFTAPGVTAGLVSARENAPDLIITDTHMRPLDGFCLIASLKSDPALSSIPILLTSASGPHGHTESRALASGAAHYLQNPIKSDELLALAADYTKRKREPVE